MKQFLLKKFDVYEQRARDILDKALGFSGLKLGQQIDYRSVRIYQKDHIHEIYTINQNTNLPHMVLIHGFGGTSMTYFRLFKNLWPFYKLHALDSLGVGHSSSGAFKENFDYYKAKQYYIDGIQKWRVALGIENFTLVGHSFGGYLAACYTEAYPDRVNRLILLSPAGTTEDTKEEYSAMQNMGFKPSKAMMKQFLGKMIDQRLNLCKQQLEVSRLYYHDLIDKQAVGQKGFFNIFDLSMKTRYPIQSIINKLNFKKPVQFYYGSHDWMDSRGAVRLSQKLNNVHYDKISSAGHQLIFENPKQLCQKILNRRINTQKPNDCHKNQ